MKKIVWLSMCVLMPAAMALAQPAHEDPAEPLDLAFLNGPPDLPFDEAFADAPGWQGPGPGFAGPNFCQSDSGWPMAKLNLTDAQKKKLREMRLQNQKELIPLRADLQTKHLDLRSEMQSDKPDLAKINGLVDQIAKVRADIQKKQIAFRFKMRDQLTPEQLKIWDANRGRMGRGFMNGPGRGMRGMRGMMSPRFNRAAPSMPDRGPSM